MAVLHLDPDRVVVGPEETRRRGGLGDRAPGLGPNPDREQLDAGCSCGPAIPLWPRCGGTCDRAGDGRYCGRSGFARAYGDWWSQVVKRQVRVVDRLGDFRLSGWCGNRCRSARFCARSVPQMADAACTKMQEFRRSGIFLRRAEADALITPIVQFVGEAGRLRSHTERQINATSGNVPLMQVLLRSSTDNSLPIRALKAPNKSLLTVCQIFRSVPRSSLLFLRSARPGRHGPAGGQEYAAITPTRSDITTNCMSRSRCWPSACRRHHLSHRASLSTCRGRWGK